MFAFSIFTVVMHIGQSLNLLLDRQIYQTGILRRREEFFQCNFIFQFVLILRKILNDWWHSGSVVTSVGSQ